MNITIDPEFRDYLSALRPEEYKTLEASIVESGCETPLIVWNSTLIDGHNRHKICTEHGLHYEIEHKQFPDRDAVIDWMLVNQLGRRNLSPDDFRLFVGRLYNARKKTVGGDRGNQYVANRQIDGQPNTAEKIASEHGTSSRTVERAGKQAEAIDTKASPALKEAVRNHDVPVSLGAKIAEFPPERQEEILSNSAKEIKEVVKASEREKQPKARKQPVKLSQRKIMFEFLAVVESLASLHGKTTPPLIIKELDETHRARLAKSMKSALILLTETEKQL